jgi:Chitin binding Peritrophin-A domain
VRRVLLISGLVVLMWPAAGVASPRPASGASHVSSGNCRGKPDGEYADPGNDSQYWQCNNQRSGSPQSCPPGKHFRESGGGRGTCR